MEVKKNIVEEYLEKKNANLKRSLGEALNINKDLRETIEEMKDYIDEIHEELLLCRNEIINNRKEKVSKPDKCQDACCWVFHLGCD